MGKAYKGEYSHSIDAKGRLIIPAKFRELLGEQFVVTKGFDGCLFAFDQEGWDAFEEKLKALPMDIPGARQLGRFFMAGADDVELDKQGRILLKANWLSHASIEKDAIVAGVGNRVEIWSKEKWEEATSFDDIDSIAEKMSAYGLSI